MKLRSFAATLLARAIAVSLLAAIILVPPAVAKNKFKLLHQFTGGNDGGGPVRLAALAMDKSGNLYGAGGGGNEKNCEGWGCGVVFEMVHGARDTWSENVLYNFGNLKNVDGPLAVDGQGMSLYGCTGDYGPMFELTRGVGQWTFNPIWQSGCIGVVGLILDSAGNLYGGFGNDSSGGVSELSPTTDGWTYTNLYDFCPTGWNCRDGESPEAPFSWDDKSNLYGSDYQGGLVNYPDCGGYCGVAFQMTPNGDGTWTYHVMHRFDSFKGDGCFPMGSLTVDSSGNAYGTTGLCGRYHDGTVFRLTPTKHGDWKETILYTFPNINTGAGPQSNLVLDKAGNLYGTAGWKGCNYTCGLVFKLSPQKNGKWIYSVLHKFNETDGDLPNGLTMDRDGNLFGTTSLGGKYGYGVVFEITP